MFINQKTVEYKIGEITLYLGKLNYKQYMEVISKMKSFEMDDLKSIADNSEALYLAFKYGVKGWLGIEKKFEEVSDIKGLKEDFLDTIEAGVISAVGSKILVESSPQAEEEKK